MLSSTLQKIKRLGQMFQGSVGSRKRTTTPLIGLDIGSQMVKMVRLKQVTRGWQLEDVQVRGLPKVKEEKTARGQEQGTEKVLKDLVEELGIHGAQVAISISGPSVMVKVITVPSMTEEELKGHLEWESDQYLPYKNDEIYWDYYVPQHNTLGSHNSMTLFLVAAKKEMVDLKVEVVKQAGLHPVVVDVDSLALANMYDLNYDDLREEPVLLVNLGPRGLNMIAVRIPEGLYIRDTALEGEWSEHVYLEEMYQEITSEIQRTLEFSRQYQESQGIHRIGLSGGYAHLPGLVDCLSTRLRMQVDIIDPFKKLHIAPETLSQIELENVSSLSGVAVGLALRCEKNNDQD